MKARVISGVIILVATVGLGLIGGIPLAVTLMAAAMIGYYELCRALGVHREGERFNALEVLGFIAAAILYGGLIYATGVWKGYTSMADINAGLPKADSMTLVVVLGLFLISMAFFVFRFPKYEETQVIPSILAFLYAPVMISFIYRALFLPYGKYVYALIFFCSWIGDTCAWFVGRKLGRHKMAPVLSPKKTIEGALGGIGGSVILCLATAVVIALRYREYLFWQFALLGIAGNLISQVGDLAASGIKRNVGLKDYGRTIPGHGGIMDRFDSVIFTAPVLYFLAAMLLGRV